MHEQPLEHRGPSPPEAKQQLRLPAAPACDWSEGHPDACRSVRNCPTSGLVTKAAKDVLQLQNLNNSERHASPARLIDLARESAELSVELLANVAPETCLPEPHTGVLVANHIADGFCLVDSLIKERAGRKQGIPCIVYDMQ